MLNLSNFHCSYKMIPLMVHGTVISGGGRGVNRCESSVVDGGLYCFFLSSIPKILSYSISFFLISLWQQCSWSLLHPHDTFPCVSELRNNRNNCCIVSALVFTDFIIFTGTARCILLVVISFTNAFRFHLQLK